ncbi:3,4-dihydroxy-2-butanone-4-phosphate synthase [Rhodococcus sp. JVH1]|uniref:3,4-dihydroxy-2-butanone-4-phosphate synthase n=1 Tax=Rhodococcus sp. JVH1 TaxID=745408 RepID=UPI0005C14987|nr:3,4-dihydroxy-2-butanone-4-phosphate synthase [Rhodococcus sp. JVH1]
MDCPTTRVQRALSDLSAGRPVVLTGTNPANDAHLVLAAEKATVESIAFMVRFGSGLICAALPGTECDRLQLTRMVGEDRDHSGIEYTVSVDAVGPGTGISATDRARTLRMLSDGSSAADAFTRPGHVLPVRTDPAGVLSRRAAAEAAVDLASVAGLRRAGTFTALVSDDDPTRISSSGEAQRFAADHGLGVVSIEDVVTYRRMAESHLLTQFTLVRESTLGHVHCVGYRSDVTDIDYVAYSLDSSPGVATPIVCLESESDPVPHLTPDIATTALTMVAEHGYGTVIVARRSNGGVLSADVNADLVEVVRECGYRSPILLNFSPEARTTMWHFGMSISSQSFGSATTDPGLPSHYSADVDRQSTHVVGRVVRGDQRGRELGFRTANLELEDSNSIADGVWAGRCTLPDGSIFTAAISIGRRPTFYGRSGARLLEAHLLDFSGDLYGLTVTVQLEHWVRGQAAFASKEELIAALSADVVRTRSLMHPVG